MGNVNMRDVAALAGVSVGTVSNVLNAPQRVSPESQRKVKAAIAKLGWVRNESARQLRAGQSRSIGMVVLDIVNPFFADIVRAAEATLDANGYSVYVGDSEHLASRENTHLDRFERDRVGGVLLAPIGDTAQRILRFRSLGIPVVLLDRGSEGSEVCSVATDDVEGGRIATRHLLDLGHRRIAFVGGPSELLQVQKRKRGALYATRNYSDSELIEIHTDALDLECGARAAATIAATPVPQRPTAAFTANDLLAIGLLQGLVQHGLRVPEDVAIVGYDDIAFAAAATVPLTSVRQPRNEIGSYAATLLLTEIEAGPETHHSHSAVVFAPELIVRASSNLKRTPARTAPTRPDKA